MSNDYTLPPVPRHPNPTSFRDDWTALEVAAILAHAHACAEHVRAPLLARIAELEKKLSANDIDRHAELTHRLLRRAKRITEQGTRIAELEAELSQVSGYCETLTQRCVDDTAENGRLRAELAAKDGEVEALRAGIQKPLDEIDDDGPKALKYARQELGAAIAARKGEGSEG